MLSSDHPPELIVCVDNKAGYTKDGTIPWHYPEDLKRFKAITMGHICVMGRHTYEDMKKFVLTKRKEVGPEILVGRTCYVVSTTEGYTAEGATVVQDIQDVYNALRDKTRKVFVIGGMRMFVRALSTCQTIHMTVIDKDYQCDRAFPIQAINSHFKITAGERNGDLYFITYTSKGKRLK